MNPSGAKVGRALADTVYNWQENRPDDLNLLCENIDLDTVDVSIKNGEYRFSPAISEVKNCKTRGVYQEFIEDLVSEIERIEKKPGSISKSEKSIADFLIGLKQHRE